MMNVQKSGNSASQTSNRPATASDTDSRLGQSEAAISGPHSACRPWRLEELSLTDVRALGFQVAVLPMGATEPHNLHLPYGTDTIEAFELADRACRIAWERGGRVVQLPAMPYGTESNLREFPLAMNLQPSTLFRVLTDLTQSLEASGVRKLVIFNSHGGNEFKPFLREVYGQTSVHLFLCNWFQMIRDVAAQVCEHPEDHAGEMETSLILHFRPELVRQTPEGELAADDGSVRPLRFEALRKGWVSVTRPWHLLTTNSGSGNPHRASAEKGGIIAQQVAERIGSFLAELSDSPLDGGFPFE
jgi:creatinine amidohydrolase